MPTWTLDHSMILSLLLDVVVGTKEEIAIRQDFCRFWDSLSSITHQQNSYYTGSKAEGLELPGSDRDFMLDINEIFHMEVIHYQSLDEYRHTFPSNVSVFLISTQNAPPGFALVEYFQNVPYKMILPCLLESLQNMNGSQYLSSDLIVDKLAITIPSIVKFKRQGPSLETWGEFDDTSDPGTDHVLSIHCKFWPNESKEWIHRSRNFDWPASLVISSIVEFGCHFVPVGHPHSDRKHIEWRISFSIAERTLVWSFNHVQMQCYAIMKIILKEFIKVRCSPQNQILCSYFLKTYLFWKYEETELNFWRADNLRACIKYLLSGFSRCVREGVLRHYFIPRFNLLSVKLTRAAQTELLQLLDIIIESDISFFKECASLQNVWSEFLQIQQSRENVLSKVKRRNLLNIDMCIILLSDLIKCQCSVLIFELIPNIFKVISEALDVCCKTPLKTIMLRIYIFIHIMTILRNHGSSGNKGVYQLYRTAQNNILPFDISTCKLWCAFFLYKRGDYLLTLDIVNQVLSSIPPFAMYLISTDKQTLSNETKQLYVDMFLNSNTTIIQRARQAWMLNLRFTRDMSESVPFGIQIELYFTGDIMARFSPLTCAYYLQFLCYHKMRQYGRRNRALQQLTEPFYNPSSYCMIHDINIAGHCLLLAGKRDHARKMFYSSYTASQRHPPEDKYNSALWYLQNCFK